MRFSALTGGLAVVAILKQQDGTWKIVYGPNEGICLDQPPTGPCQGFKQPIPLPLLQSLIAKATPSPTPELYVHNGYELGSLYAYPNFPAKIALDNHDYLSGLNWTQVSPSGATATGTLNVNNCTPSCAGGSYVQTQVRLQASDPQQCSVSVFSPDSDVSQQEQAYVFNKLQVTALTGSLPSWVAGPSPPALPAACS